MNARPLPAYMQCPLIPHAWIIKDQTAPGDWSRYDEPTFIRSPPYVRHATERWQRIAQADNVCWFHKRQAD